MAGKRLIVSDIDGTLLDDGQPTAGLSSLKALLTAFHEDIYIVYATGRSFASTWKLIAEGILPLPNGIAPFVGTEVWHPPWESPDLRYERMLSHGWERRRVMEVMRAFGDVTSQPERFQSPLKASFYLEDEQVVPILERALFARGLRVNVVYSCGKYLDILPEKAGKRQAADYFRRIWDIDDQDILTCGDSGNDIDMLTDPRFLGVAVGNAELELGQIQTDETFHESTLPHAAGVLEGAEAFHFWPV